MSDADSRITVRFVAAQAQALSAKSKQVGMTDSELIRLAVASFLAKEDALADYLEAIERLDGKLACLMKRQELFARAIGSVSAAPDSVKNRELAGQLSDKFNQIIDTTEVENGN